MESYPKTGDSTAIDCFSAVLLDQYTEVDVSSEWLSSFVEECLSSSAPKDHQTTNTTSSKLPQVNRNPEHAIPAKPRGQRKRRAHSNWSNELKQRSASLQSAFNEPPLLQQTYWLADSELLTTPWKEKGKEEEEVKMENEYSQGQQQQQQSRRCSHCQAQKTPQWRAGPLGPKTLCNACGMRYFKSGKLLPEYRPAKSPTFLSYKHSNSHKKVLQMRMSSP